MNACLFLSFSIGSSVPPDEHSWLDRLLRAAPRLLKALVHTPSAAKHPYLEESPSPGLVLQLYFTDLLDLEASLSRNGNLRALNSPMEFPILALANITEQAMVVRSFDVAARNQESSGKTFCSYLVSYRGGS